MSQTLTDLINTVQVEQLDKYLFRGLSFTQPHFPRVYGGQAIAQSLNATLRTVPENRTAHSLHGYFLLLGNPQKPILYEVDPIRDGGSFSTRRVVAKQDGRAIFNCAISFHVEEDGFEHQIPIPDMPSPHQLEPMQEILTRLNQGHEKNIFGDPKLFEAWDIRPTHFPDPHNPKITTANSGIWLKTKNELPDDPALHQTLLAYISDFGLVLSATNPHPVSFYTPGMEGASLDHAMWFHSPCRADQWLLYAFDSPRATNARGFSRGSFYTAEGDLAASTAQEGLMRFREKTNAPEKRKKKNGVKLGIY